MVATTNPGFTYTMGPPKTKFLDVFKVNNLVLGGQHLYFSLFWGLMVGTYTICESRLFGSERPRKSNDCKNKCPNWIC